MKAAQTGENPSTDWGRFHASLDKNIAHWLKLWGVAIPVAMKHFKEASTTPLLG